MKRILLLFVLAGVGCEEGIEPIAVDTLHRPGLDGSNADACVGPPSDLVSWWPLDENVGPTSGDIIADNHGTHMNGPTPVAAGKVAGALSFDGADDFVAIPHDPALQSAEITVDAWIKGNKNEQRYPLSLVVDKSHGAGDFTGWVIQIDRPSGRIAFNVGNGSGFPGLLSASDVLDDAWHFVAATLGGGEMKIYVDGVLENTVPFSGAPLGNTRNVNIGAWWGGGFFQRHFKGLIDEVEVFSRALTADEIAAMYEAGSAGKCKSMSIQVEIDIKPGSDPNCFNNDGHGVIPVAILGSASFDVRDVDPASVQLEGVAVSARGKSNKLLAHYEDTNGDGFEDLIVQIEDADGAFASGSGTATLFGSLFDATPIEGSDEICIVP